MSTARVVAGAAIDGTHTLVYHRGVVDPVTLWRRMVESRGECACGSRERLTAQLVIPLEYGGKLHPDNGVLLCRSCLFARHRQHLPGAKRYFQCLLSPEDNEFLTQWAARMGHTRTSWVRVLFSEVARTPEAFSDFAGFTPEEPPPNAVRVNFPMDAAVCEAFEAAARPLTMVGALRALLKMRKTLGHD